MKAPVRLPTLAAALVLGGCINLGLGNVGGYPNLHRHTLDTATGVTARPGAAPALAVRGFSSRSRYDIRVVRRGDADDFSYLEFERWGELPASAVTDAVREALAASKAFKSVTSAGDALVVERFLDGYVLAFDLVKTPSGPWKARVSLRLVLSDRLGNLLHTSVYTTEHNLPGSDPVGLGPAMSAAVGDAVNRALADWETAGLLK
jgi:ABC-type uncharacterized transport system auxiliary subunit